MKRFFGLLNLILCLELIIGPNFPGTRIFTSEVAKAETCPSGLIFDSTLNRCITSDQNASLINATASCNGDRECYKRLAEEELKKGEEEGKITAAVKDSSGLFNKAIGIAAIAAPLLAAYTTIAVPGACGAPSRYAMMAGGVAQLAGHVMTMGKHKKCLEKIKKDWEEKKSATDGVSSSKVSVAGAQSEAFEMLAKSEECTEKTAKTKATFYALSAAAFAASAVLAGLEIIRPGTAECVTYNNTMIDNETMIVDYKAKKVLKSALLETEDLASFMTIKENFEATSIPTSCASIERFESFKDAFETANIQEEDELLISFKHVTSIVWNEVNIFKINSASAQSAVVGAVGGGAVSTGVAVGTGALTVGTTAATTAVAGGAATAVAGGAATAVAGGAATAVAGGAATAVAGGAATAVAGGAATTAVAGGAATAVAGGAATTAVAGGAATTAVAGGGAAAAGGAGAAAAGGATAATGGIRGFLISPVPRMIISGVLAGWSAMMWQHSNKQARASKNRAAFLRKLKGQFNDANGAISCTAEERSTSANANCYCYTEGGQRNTARANSQVCQQLFAGQSLAKAGDYNTLPGGSERVCIAKNGSADSSCSCAKTKSCLNAIPGGVANLGIGAISAANAGLTPTNDIASGKIAVGDLNGAATLGTAARILAGKKDLDKKLKLDPNKKSKLTQAIEGALIAGGAGTPSPLIADSSLPMNMSPSQAAQELEKELGGERSFERVSGSPAVGQPGNSTPGDETGFSLGSAEPVVPSQEAQLAEVMKQDLNYDQADITKSNSNLFQILSNRYQRSGMRRLFDESGKDAPVEASNKNDITQ